MSKESIKLGAGAEVSLGRFNEVVTALRDLRTEFASHTVRNHDGTGVVEDTNCALYAARYRSMLIQEYKVGKENNPFLYQWKSALQKKGLMSGDIMDNETRAIVWNVTDLYGRVDIDDNFQSHLV